MGIFLLRTNPFGTCFTGSHGSDVWYMILHCGLTDVAVIVRAFLAGRGVNNKLGYCRWQYGR